MEHWKDKYTVEQIVLLLDNKPPNDIVCPYKYCYNKVYAGEAQDWNLFIDNGKRLYFCRPKCMVSHVRGK
jgi:hypothetical protein